MVVVVVFCSPTQRQAIPGRVQWLQIKIYPEEEQARPDQQTAACNSVALTWSRHVLICIIPRISNNSQQKQQQQPNYPRQPQFFTKKENIRLLFQERGLKTGGKLCHRRVTTDAMQPTFYKLVMNVKENIVNTFGAKKKKNHKKY